MQQGFDTQEITRKLDGLTNGLSDGFYAQNTTMLNGFERVNSNVFENRFAMQAMGSEFNRNLDATRYENAQNTCAIEKAIHAEGEATRQLIQTNEIQALRDKVQELSLSQSQCTQEARLTNTLRPYPIPTFPANNLYGWGCGCNACGNNI